MRPRLGVAIGRLTSRSKNPFPPGAYRGPAQLAFCVEATPAWARRPALCSDLRIGGECAQASSPLPRFGSLEDAGLPDC